MILIANLMAVLPLSFRHGSQVLMGVSLCLWLYEKAIAKRQPQSMWMPGHWLMHNFYPLRNSHANPNANPNCETERRWNVDTDCQPKIKKWRCKISYILPLNSSISPIFQKNLLSYNINRCHIRPGIKGLAKLK